MPIVSQEESINVFYPLENFTAVRYLDLTKFLSMLHRSSLFFCRLEKMEDKFEGTPPKYTEKQRLEIGELAGSPEGGKKLLKDLNNTQKFSKGICCVNCWNIFRNESAALWKIYSDFDKGIMIKTSVNRIRDSFKNTQDAIFISTIKYIDYSKESLPVFENLFQLAIHKQSAYSYEDEVRLIYLEGRGWERDGTKDWSKEEVPEGVYMYVDLDILIEEIIVGPYVPEWFLKLLRELIAKYSLRKAINRSQLTFS